MAMTLPAAALTPDASVTSAAAAAMDKPTSAPEGTGNEDTLGTLFGKALAQQLQSTPPAATQPSALWTGYATPPPLPVLAQSLALLPQNTAGPAASPLPTEQLPPDGLTEAPHVTGGLPTERLMTTGLDNSLTECIATAAAQPLPAAHQSEALLSVEPVVPAQADPTASAEPEETQPLAADDWAHWLAQLFPAAPVLQALPSEWQPSSSASGLTVSAAKLEAVGWLDEQESNPLISATPVEPLGMVVTDPSANHAAASSPVAFEWPPAEVAQAPLPQAEASGITTALSSTTSQQNSIDLFGPGDAALAAVDEPTRSVSLQVGDALRTSLNTGSPTVQLRLQPDDLGTVRIQLQQTADGQINARFIVERPEALEQLQHQHHDLKLTLKQHGIDLAESTFRLAGMDEEVGRIAARLEGNRGASDSTSGQPNRDAQQNSPFQQSFGQASSQQQPHHQRTAPEQQIPWSGATRSVSTNSRPTSPTDPASPTPLVHEGTGRINLQA